MSVYYEVSDGSYYVHYLENRIIVTNHPSLVKDSSIPERIDCSILNYEWHKKWNEVNDLLSPGDGTDIELNLYGTHLSESDRFIIKPVQGDSGMCWGEFNETPGKLWFIAEAYRTVVAMSKFPSHSFMRNVYDKNPSMKIPQTTEKFLEWLNI